MGLTETKGATFRLGGGRSMQLRYGSLEKPTVYRCAGELNVPYTPLCPSFYIKIATLKTLRSVHQVLLCLRYV
jgi:hypothetical protein